MMLSLYSRTLIHGDLAKVAARGLSSCCKFRPSFCHIRSDQERGSGTLLSNARHFRTLPKSAKLFDANNETGNFGTFRRFSSQVNIKSEDGDAQFDDSEYTKQLDKRFTVLGKSVLQNCLTEHFMETYPSLDALQIANLVGHVTKEIMPLKSVWEHSDVTDMSQKRAKMYAAIGKSYSEEGKDVTFGFIKDLQQTVFHNDELELYCKLAHPGTLLRAIASVKDLQFEARQVGYRIIEIYIDGELVSKGSASSIEKAEYETCLSVIREKYMDDIKSIILDPTEMFHKGMFKGKFDGQRVVELSKPEDGNFGLFLKGGEQATIQNKKFWEYNYIEPIFINKIQEGSPAADSGLLREGDVILAIGDFILEGITMKAAVSMINKENEVSLTVKYDSTIKIKDKIKMEFKERENKAFKETLKSDQWRKWHEENAAKNPEKYLKVK